RALELSEMPKSKLNLPAYRLVALAAAAGLIAGVIAVYVMGVPEGNMDAAQSACAAKSDTAEALQPAMVGEVAAMLPADPPQALTDLTFNGPDGKPMKLSDLAGKTILLNLWATCFVP